MATNLATPRNYCMRKPQLYKTGFIRSRKDENENVIIYYNALQDNGFPDQIKELKEDIKILLNE